MANFSLFLGLLLVVGSCKSRKPEASELQTELAFFETNGRVSFPNANQLTYLSELAYRGKEEVEVFAKEFEFSLDEFSDENGTAYFVISSDKFIIVSFRGTEKRIEDFRTDFKLYYKKFKSGYVHCGFCQAYASVRENLRKVILELHMTPTPRELYITGHSLGGALANIAALDLVDFFAEISDKNSNTSFKKFNITGLYTFGAPRVFNEEGADYLNNRITNHFRFVHGQDLVVKVPTGFLGYKHGGRGFFFGRKDCQLEMDGDHRALNKKSLFSNFLGWKSKALKFSLKDHSLAKYRECFLKMNRKPL